MNAVASVADVLEQLAMSRESEAAVLRAQARVLRIAEHERPAGTASETHTLSISDVCKRLNVGETFVRGLIAKGHLSVVRLSNRPRVRESDLAAFLDRRTQ